MCNPNAGYRYYVCARSVPHYASRLGKPLHPMAPVPAIPLETEAWAAVGHALMTRELLDQGITEARRHHEEAAARWHDRLTAIDGEVARLRRRLDRATVERLDAEPGTEAARSLARTIADTEREISRYLTERASFELVDTPGLSEEEAAALHAFADEVRNGLDAATPDERRQIYGLLKLRGRVQQDAAGMPLGKRHRFTVEWEAVINLSALVSGDRSFS